MDSVPDLASRSLAAPRDMAPRRLIRYHRAMGITAKIWADSEIEVSAMLADPKRVGSRFYAKPTDEYALIHSARSRGLDQYLASKAAHGGGLGAIPGASNITYVLPADRVRVLAETPTSSPFHRLLTDYPTDAINRVEIADVVRAAAGCGHGLVFCLFEDW
ncbi:MAG TPA: hypothetical protein VFQ61_22015 [Polyangiaceae bacterium]|nr:hypothetical protein [Polyangiaceae bacterium]